MSHARASQTHNSHNPTDANPQDDAHPAEPPSDQFTRLVPLELECFLQDRPLLPFENIDTYDNLQHELIISYQPKDALEVILMKELADAIWTVRRYRRMRQAVLDAYMTDIAWDIIGFAFVQAFYPDMQKPDASSNPSRHDDSTRGEMPSRDSEDEMERLSRAARTDFNAMFRSAKSGDHKMRKGLDRLMEDAGITFDTLYQSAFLKALSPLSSIDDMLSRADKLRDDVITMMDTRRRTSEAMSRALLTRGGR